VTVNVQSPPPGKGVLKNILRDSKGRISEVVETPVAPDPESNGDSA
jgi:hypothetical protein